MIKFTVLTITCLILNFYLCAQVLVADINPGPFDASSSPADLVAFRGLVAFTADTETQGRELWLTDGSASGTAIVADIFPGAASGIIRDRLPGGQDVPFRRQSAVLDGRLFFVADDGLFGPQIWSTDGSAAGTRPLTRLPGIDLYYGLTPVNGRLFFFTYDRRQQWRLWQSDGTEKGTLVVRGDFGAEAPGDMRAADRFFYFSTEPAGAGLLWRSDGTGNGTIVVADQLYAPGVQDLDRLSHLAALGSRLFFAARRLGATPDPNTVGLWLTDGTFEGTAMLAEVGVVSAQGYPEGGAPVVAGGKAFFLFINRRASELALWSSDGTAPGTRTLYSAAAASSDLSFRPSNLAYRTPGQFLFNGPADGGGTAMILFDLSRELAIPLAILASDEPPVPHIFFEESASWYFVDRLGRILLLSRYGASRVTLWRSNGTILGTKADTTLSPYLGAPDQALLHDTLLLFPGIDTAGLELWKTSARAKASRLVNLDTATDAFFGPGNLSPTGSFLVSPAYRPDLGLELWSADATGARLARDTWQGTPSGTGFSGVSFRGRFYFAGETNETGEELWSSDGTEQGTALVADIRPGSGSSSPDHFVTSGERLFFVATGPDRRQSIWMTDGTPGGLRQVFSFGPDDLGIFIRVKRLQAAGEGRLMAVTTFNADELIWFSDGTPAGTLPVLKPLREVGPAVVIKDVAYFSARLPDSPDLELWRSDGRPGGTTRVADVAPGEQSSSPEHLILFRGRIFFVADDGSRGRELWSSDGTAPGTRLVAELFPGAFDGITDPHFSVFRDRLYFQGGDAASGRELWSTDGTPAGTRLEADINGGPAGSCPSGLTALADRLLFSAFTPDRGVELWVFDREQFPRRLTDIWPGSGNANPYGFTLLDGDLFFIADDGRTGRELWRLGLNTVGVNSPENTPLQVRLAPNPVSGMLSVSLGQNGQMPAALQLELFDSAGNRLRRWERRDLPPGETICLHLDDLPPGAYFLRIYGREADQTLKVVKMRD